MIDQQEPADRNKVAVDAQDPPVPRSFGSKTMASSRWKPRLSLPHSGERLGLPTLERLSRRPRPSLSR